MEKTDKDLRNLEAAIARTKVWKESVVIFRVYTKRGISRVTLGLNVDKEAYLKLKDLFNFPSPGETISDAIYEKMKKAIEVYKESL